MTKNEQGQVIEVDGFAVGSEWLSRPSKGTKKYAIESIEEVASVNGEEPTYVVAVRSESKRKLWKGAPARFAATFGKPGDNFEVEKKPKAVKAPKAPKQPKAPKVKAPKADKTVRLSFDEAVAVTTGAPVQAEDAISLD